jgi:photosystem II stability/assembly factor-like uncharacterized protein
MPLSLIKKLIMKKNVFTLIMLLALISLKAQQGYHIQTPIGNGTEMRALNNDSLYLSSGVNGNSHIVYINSNTKEWKYINTNPLPNYGTPVMRDKNNGILRTSNGQSVQATSDGWQTVTTSTATIKFAHKSPAGYYGLNFLSSSSYSLYFSTDGLNWNLSQAAGTITSMKNFGNKVYAFGGGSLSYVSMNGGQTYTSVANTGTFTGTFVDFYMASADTFIVIMSGSVCKSYNGGTTWTNTPLPGAVGGSVAFKNKNEFAVQPLNGTTTFSYTTDGGTTWSANSNPPPAPLGGRLTYINNYYYMYPHFRTNDYGATWEHFLPNLAGQVYSIDFNGNKGLLGMKSGKYAYSLNKGRSVTHFTNTISSNEDIMAAKVLSNGTFLAGDRKGQIYTSSNNGQTWVNKNTSGSNLNSIRFLMSANENTIVLTRAGLPMVSTDAGATFSMVTYAINGGTHATAIKPNGQLMDARDVNGFEMRTFDQSGNTNVIYTYTSTGSESLAGFYMVNDNIGYVMTRDNNAKTNKIYKTTDGGNTFTPKTDIGQVVNGASAYINAPFVSGVPLFYSFGVDTIIVTANYNNYYHISVDGATTWSTVMTPFNNTTYGTKIYKMNFFTSKSYIASTGDSFNPLGLYLNTQGGSSTTIGIKELNFTDKKGSLVLFPNPAANATLISFLNSEEVQVNIFNMSGHLIRSQFTNSGTFSIEDLASGLYIVRVQEKDKAVRTAKLVIQ